MLARCWGVAENGETVEVALKPHLVDELDNRWPPFGLRRQYRPAEPVTARFGLSNAWLVVPDVEESGDSPPPVAWDLLESELALFSVRRLVHLVAAHAAVISRGGKAMVIPGSSGAGKSTLAVAAAGVGATVLSDEFTLINPRTGLVTGWTRPVRLKGEGGTERVDLATKSDPLPVGLVAFVSYEANADNHWSPIPRSEAVVEFLNHTITTRSRPDDTFDAALAVIRSALTISGVRGEASGAITGLLELLDQSAE